MCDVKMASKTSVIALVIAVVALVVSAYPSFMPIYAPLTPARPDFDLFIQPGFASGSEAVKSSYSVYPAVVTKGQWLTVKSLGNFSGEVTLFFVEVPNGMTVVFKEGSSLLVPAGKVAQTHFDLVVTGPLPKDWQNPGWQRITLVAVGQNIVHTKSFPVQIVP